LKSYFNYPEALKKYLVDKLKVECEIYSEVIPQNNVQRFILLVDTGGKVTDNINLVRYEPELMVICQDTDNYQAKQLAYAVFEAFGQVYDISLTFDNFGVEKTLNFATIRAEETPTPLGNIGNGLYQYLITFKILVGGEYEETT